MAASISIAGELLRKMSLISQLKNFSYRQYCQALTERDAVQLDDFKKLSISEHHDIELWYCFKNGVFNPSHVIDYFARYTDKNCNELRELVIKCAKQKREHCLNVASIVLPLKPLGFDDWCDIMSDCRNACDELFLFMLCELHNRHAVVFMSNQSWSMVQTDEPMTEDQIYAACDLHLIFLGQDVYGELMLKPTVNIPFIPSSASLQSIDKNIDSQEVVPDNKHAENSHKQASPDHIHEKADSNTVESDPDSDNHADSGSMDQSSVEDQQPVPLNPWIPPIKPFLLPLKFIVLDYLRSCDSPLVNPVVLPAYTVNGLSVSTGQSNEKSGENSPNIVSDGDAKSTNDGSLSISLDSILKQTCGERHYHVDLKVLTQKEINQATGVVPHWSELDPYSSLEEEQSTSSSSENSEIEEVIEPSPKHENLNVVEPEGRMTLRPRKRRYLTQRSRRANCSNVFYRDMCEEKPRRSQRPPSRRVMPEPSDE